MGTGKEAEQDRLRMQLLDHIIEAHDDVVTASSLTTGENASNLKQQNLIKRERVCQLLFAEYDITFSDDVICAG